MDLRSKNVFFMDSDDQDWTPLLYQIPIHVWLPFSVLGFWFHLLNHLEFKPVRLHSSPQPTTTGFFTYCMW